MPYIVTTKRPTVGYDVTAGQEPITERGESVSRCAVATLEEARNRASREVVKVAIARLQPLPNWNLLCERIPESGGTVGPLPDGTVIEVERIGSAELWARAGQPEGAGMDQAKILAAYNAAQQAVA